MEGLDELERYLETATILDVSTGSVTTAHHSFRLTFEGGVAALAKPTHTAPGDGESMVRYEVAAWVVAKALGWTDLVATTVLRPVDLFPDADGEVDTSIQVLWPSFDLDADRAQFSDEDTWRAAIFDVLIYHTDRGHNWGAVPGHGRPRLKLIDHGYCFKDWSGREFQSVFADDHAGEALPDGPLEDIAAS